MPGKTNDGSKQEQEKASDVSQQNEDKLVSEIPKAFIDLLDKINYEIKMRSATEQKALDVKDKDNERTHEEEMLRIEIQKDVIKRSQKLKTITHLSVITFLFLLFFAIIYFSFYDRIDIIEKVFFPFTTLVLGAFGGYGFGYYKGKREYDYNDSY